MKHVFGTVGLPGSGKSTFGEVATDLLENVEFVSMGDIVRKLALREGFETSSEIGEFATEMRDIHGEGIFAEKLVEMMDFSEDTILIIDGIRSPKEITKLRSTVSANCTIVYIKADQSVRYQRVVDRGREDENKMDKKEFQERDNREIGWGFDEIIEEEMYDEIITNEQSMEEFENKIIETIHKYI